MAATSTVASLPTVASRPQSYDRYITSNKDLTRHSVMTATAAPHHQALFHFPSHLSSPAVILPPTTGRMTHSTTNFGDSSECLPDLDSENVSHSSLSHIVSLRSLLSHFWQSPPLGPALMTLSPQDVVNTNLPKSSLTCSPQVSLSSPPSCLSAIPSTTTYPPWYLVQQWPRHFKESSPQGSLRVRGHHPFR
jgi:hypothetical protein